MNLPKIVGILNITPDSFSDGGKYDDLELALNQTEKLIIDGADIIDIGAESTRPNGKLIDSTQEWERLRNILPEVLKVIKSACIKSSIDTYHSQTAKKAIDLGIDIINDVSSTNADSMKNLVRDNKVKIVITHSIGLPANPKNIIDPNIDVIDFLGDFLSRKIKELAEYNIDKNQIIFDPGIGFGKNSSQSFNIIKNIDKFISFGVEIMIGHSRKSFYNLITDIEIKERDLETHITSIYLAQRKVSYIRVHDVIGAKRSFNLASMLGIC